MKSVRTFALFILLALIAGAGMLVTPLLYARQPVVVTLPPEPSAIGVSVRDLTLEEADQAGIVVDRVIPESPAEQSGIKPGDFISVFDGQRIRSARQFERLVREAAPGRPVVATVVRKGRTLKLRITPLEQCDLPLSAVARL
jgi:S1-C subfamily serine protease